MTLDFRACAVTLFLACFPNPADATCADLSLVLAIDSSGSIDDDEFGIQTVGYAAAFQSLGVKRALAAAGVVDVAAIYWADADFAFQAIPWHRITSPQNADAFAAMLLTTKRRVFGDTDLGNGLNSAIDLLAHPDRCTIRAVINVSGDGEESIAAKRKAQIPLAFARKRAADLGIIVNGLVIENEVPELAQYYRDKVISGPGSFVIDIKDFTSFGTAIQEKLKQEIGPSLLSNANFQTWHSRFKR